MNSKCLKYPVIKEKVTTEDYPSSSSVLLSDVLAHYSLWKDALYMDGNHICIVCIERTQLLSCHSAQRSADHHGQMLSYCHVLTLSTFKMLWFRWLFIYCTYFAIWMLYQWEVILSLHDINVLYSDNGVFEPQFKILFYLSYLLSRIIKISSFVFNSCRHIIKSW